MTCTSELGGPDQTRYDAALPAIQELEIAYVECAATNTLHRLSSHNSVGGLSGEELKSLYTQHFARRGSLGRVVYDRIMAGALHQRCPLCGQGRVSTLDHHLPKKSFPGFAVTPANLIPACRDCNLGGKKGFVAASAAEETFHPYFDDFGTELWLEALLVKGAPLAVVFEVRAPASASGNQLQRVKAHFDVFQLGPAFASAASAHLTAMKRRLVSLASKGGADHVAVHLKEEADSYRAAAPNSWQVELYEKLAGDTWFCGGGFVAIAE